MAQTTLMKTVKKNEKKRLQQVIKLRQLANNLEKSIQEKRADRLANTPRRLRIAASILRDADILERLQKVTLSIAQSIEDGEAIYLKSVKNRVQIETLIREILILKHQADAHKPFYEAKYTDTEEREVTLEDIENATMPRFECSCMVINMLLNELNDLLEDKEELNIVKQYIDQYSEQDNDYVDLFPIRKEIENLVKIGKKFGRSKYTAERIHNILLKQKRLESLGITDDTKFRAALLELMPHLNETKKSEHQKRLERVKLREKEMARKKIPGYFPTPKPIVKKMIAKAKVSPGMKVLEPSAGSGHIADELLKIGADIDVIEIDYDLRQILEDKGHHLVEWNFLEFKENEKYDRIIMNPPFERGQDIDHIKHAFNLLKPGGIVVALMSEGPFFRQDRKSKEWRNFLDEIDGSTQKLPPNVFRESDRPTGVQIRLVTLQKPHSPSKTPSYDQFLAV